MANNWTILFNFAGNPQLVSGFESESAAQLIADTTTKTFGNVGYVLFKIGADRIKWFEDNCPPEIIFQYTLVFGKDSK